MNRIPEVGEQVRVSGLGRITGVFPEYSMVEGRYALAPFSPQSWRVEVTLIVPIAQVEEPRQ